MNHDPDEEFTNEDEDNTEANVDELDDSSGINHATVTNEEQTRAAKRRDCIAKEMWDNYIARAPGGRR